jgi:tRNA nucleotidyltransferase/poly(A) polymerase
VSPFINHPQWPAIEVIHKKLSKEGFQSLIAGGAVRDLLLQRMPNDIDIATDAKPEQVEALFEKTVMVGKAFGVSRVLVAGQDIEVATFRKDGPYLDGRKPESIEFSSMEEDAKRRDFTINALFYDIDKKEIIDFVNGQNDVMKKTIRTVGLPEKRFEEDKLRILRAVRFHAQLGFHIEQHTSEAIRKFSIMIHQVSMERVRDEWEKVLKAEKAVSGMGRTYDLGLWSPLFGSWKYNSEEYKKIFDVNKGKDEEILWILWFLVHCQESKEKLAELGLHWKLPKKMIQKMIYCYQSLSQLRNIQNVAPVDLAIFLAKPNGRLALEVFTQLHQGKIKEDFFAKLKKAESFFQKGVLPEILINGEDLIQFGVAPGPQIAKELKRLYRLQLLEGIKNKEALLQKLSD